MTIMSIYQVVKNDATGHFWKALKVDGRFLLLDLALVIGFIVLVLTNSKIVIFHVAFLLLTFGAFFWEFHAFVLRTIFWLTTITSVLFVSIFSGEIPFEEIFEIPALTSVLVLVYIIAGQRSRAVNALQERTDELSMLLEVSNQTTLAQKLEPLLGLILDHLKAVVDYENATIFRLDDEILTTLIDRGSTRQDGDIPLSVSIRNTRIGRKLLVDQEPVIIADMWGEAPLARDLREVFGNQFKAASSESSSWMGIPLTVNDRVTGVLALEHSAPLGHYAPNHADLVLGFANQAAVAIEAARHYEQAQTLAALEERQRLARDLHDAVSQTLFSACLTAEVLPRLWERNPPEAHRCLDEIYYLNRSALAEMRTLLMELRPEALTEMELGELLGQLTESLGNRVRLPLVLKAEKVGQLPPDVQIALYRISQEALNNIIKHAAASRAEVSLRTLSFKDRKTPGKGLELRIVDNGRGFNTEAVLPASMGLGIMRERAEAIGADFRVESEIGRGTEVVIFWIGAS